MADNEQARLKEIIQRYNNLLAERFQEEERSRLLDEMVLEITDDPSKDSPGTVRTKDGVIVVRVQRPIESHGWVRIQAPPSIGALLWYMPDEVRGWQVVQPVQGTYADKGSF